MCVALRSTHTSCACACVNVCIHIYACACLRMYRSVCVCVYNDDSSQLREKVKCFAVSAASDSEQIVRSSHIECMSITPAIIIDYARRLHIFAAVDCQS